MLKKILLACSIVSFAIGFSDLGKAPQWDLGRPIGAVLFILFLITMMLEKEVAIYDREESEKTKPVRAKVSLSTDVRSVTSHAVR